MLDVLDLGVLSESYLLIAIVFLAVAGLLKYFSAAIAKLRSIHTHSLVGSFLNKIFYLLFFIVIIVMLSRHSDDFASFVYQYQERQERLDKERIENQAEIEIERMLAEERWRAAEARYLADEKKRDLEARRLAEEQRAIEARRLAEEQRAAEARRLAEEQRAAEARRLAEEQRAAEARRLAEEQRAAEARRLAEEQKRVTEARRLAEEQKRAAEARRLAEEKKRKDKEREKSLIASLKADAELLEKMRDSFFSESNHHGKIVKLRAFGKKLAAIKDSYHNNNFSSESYVLIGGKIKSYEQSLLKMQLKIANR